MSSLTLPCHDQLYPLGAIRQKENHPYTANLIYPVYNQPSLLRKRRKKVVDEERLTNVLRLGLVLLILQLVLLLTVLG